MIDKKPLFKSPYNLRDVGALFGLVALVLIISAILGNYLFGIFQNSFFQIKFMYIENYYSSE